MRSGCRAPTKEPEIEAKFSGTELHVWQKFRSWVEALPTPQRQCLVNTIGDTTKQVFLNCLGQYEPGLTIPALSDSVQLPPDVLQSL